MVKSMTGYGRAAAELESGKLILEIKTLNSKGCDINIKTSLMGPLAGVGDTIWQGVLIPILLALCIDITLGGSGNVWARLPTPF